MHSIDVDGIALLLFASRRKSRCRTRCLRATRISASQSQILGTISANSLSSPLAGHRATASNSSRDSRSIDIRTAILHVGSTLLWPLVERMHLKSQPIKDQKKHLAEFSWG